MKEKFKKTFIRYVFLVYVTTCLHCLLKNSSMSDKQVAKTCNSFYKLNLHNFQSDGK